MSALLTAPREETPSMCCAPFSKLRLAERQSGSDQAGIASLLDPGERSEPGPSPQTSCCTNSAQPSLWIVLSCKLPKGNLGAQPLAAGSSGHVMAGSLLSLKEVCFSVRDAPSLSHLDTRQHKTPHLLKPDTLSKTVSSLPYLIRF